MGQLALGLRDSRPTILNASNLPNWTIPVSPGPSTRLRNWVFLLAEVRLPEPPDPHGLPLGGRRGPPDSIVAAEIAGLAGEHSWGGFQLARRYLACTRGFVPGSATVVLRGALSTPGGSLRTGSGRAG
jgi:hypothetical protein